MPSDDSKIKTPSPQKPRRLIRFLKCLIIAVLAVAFLAGGILYFNFYLPQGKGPAGPDVPAEPFNHIWSEKKVSLLGIGDSITAGFGARDGYSYFDRLIKNPDEDCPDMLGKNLSVVFPNLTSINIASSGSTSIYHLTSIIALQKFPKDVLGIVVMTTGGNDLIQNYGRIPPKEGAMYGASIEQALPWIDNFQRRLDEMMIELKDLFPGGCHIFLANIYDPTDGTGNTSCWLTGLPPWPDGLAILEAYNDILSKCAEKYENVHLVDIHKPFLGHGIHCRKFWIKRYRRNDPTYWYYLNIEDPSERGYDAIRRLFLNEMIMLEKELKNYAQ
ncbi:MAG: SGNH/GDSL hydrolase family protein [Sedimentisphaerales bacterium]|nr:SGNH/GDSL hydrolase family protein [Sedimentisphaerales bacterium]